MSVALKLTLEEPINAMKNASKCLSAITDGVVKFMNMHFSKSNNQSTKCLSF